MSNPIETATYQSAAGGSRSLFVRGARSDDSTIMTVVDTDNTRRGLFLSDKDAIDLALRILRAKAPHWLREPTFSETPVGTYLANRRTGEVVKVVAWSEELFPAWKEDGVSENETFAVTSTGRAIVPWQDPDNDEEHWEVVEVKETTQIVWTPIPKA